MGIYLINANLQAEAASSTISTSVMDQSTIPEKSLQEDLVSNEVNYRKWGKIVSPILDKIKTLHPSLESLLNQGRVHNVTVQNQSWPHSYIPSHERLQKTADYYKEKYGISIHLCTIDQFIEHIRTSERGWPSEGFIINQEISTQREHSTPVLVHYTKEAIEVVVLDSLGAQTQWDNPDPSNHVVRLFYALRGETSIRLFFTREKRQADFFSCHTDALIILRNALLDLKRRSAISLSERLLNLKAGTGKYDPEFYCDLPHEWDYTSQIYNKLEGNETALVPRDFFSRSLQKRENPRFVVQFRALHYQNVRYLIQLVISDNKMREPCLDLGQAMLHSSYDLIIDHYQKDKFTEFSLNIRAESLQNTYYAVKGFKLHRSIALPQDVRWQPYFLRTESLACDAICE